MNNSSRILVFVFSAICGVQVLAAGSPWLPAPQGGNVSVSYVNQEATEFFRQTSKVPTPGGGHELSQSTIWVTGTYGISDAVAFDFQLGRAESSYATGVGLPPSRANISDLTDINLGVTWRVVDEVVNPDLPSIALRAGLIRAGNYETGLINSIGDGGDGFEFSAMAGKFVSDRFALSAEIGYRDRDSDTHDIPANWFYRFRAGYFVSNQVSLSLNYDIEDATSGLNIGIPPFSPARFPDLEEDIHLFGPAVNLVVSDQVNVSASYARVIDGRNTAASDVFGISVNYSFF